MESEVYNGHNIFCLSLVAQFLFTLLSVVS